MNDYSINITVIGDDIKEKSEHIWLYTLHLKLIIYSIRTKDNAFRFGARIEKDNIMYHDRNKDESDTIFLNSDEIELVFRNKRNPFKYDMKPIAESDILNKKLKIIL